MPTQDKSRPLTSLLTHVVSEVAYLLQTEIRLARAEVGEKLGNAAHGAAFAAAGALLAFAGLIVVLFGAVRWLEIAGLRSEWGFTLVGLGVLAVGGILVMMGLRSFKSSALVPNRTIEQVRADFSVVKEQVQ